MPCAPGYDRVAQMDSGTEAGGDKSAPGELAKYVGRLVRRLDDKLGALASFSLPADKPGMDGDTNEEDGATPPWNQEGENVYGDKGGGARMGSPMGGRWDVTVVFLFYEQYVHHPVISMR